ncbi:MAG: DUF4199 domain-containing protein [Thermoanaerobaculia bacterium]
MSMQRTILKWGLLSGAILGGLMALTIPFADSTGSHSLIIGYATMVLSALMIFFGVRSYRENAGAGRLTFGRGFLIGAGIAAVAGVCYVATWLILYYNVFPDFYDKYATQMLDRAKASGASAEKLAGITTQADQIRQISGKPLMIIGMTFLEYFPVGLVVALLSAGMLRRQPKAV